MKGLLAEQEFNRFRDELVELGYLEHRGDRKAAAWTEAGTELLETAQQQPDLSVGVCTGVVVDSEGQAQSGGGWLSQRLNGRNHMLAWDKWGALLFFWAVGDAVGLGLSAREEAGQRQRCARNYGHHPGVTMDEPRLECWRTRPNSGTN